LNGVGTLVAIISQLNALPACAPVNASMVTLRLATHDSGPGWIATPFPYDSFIHNSTPVYPGALRSLLGHRGVLATPIGEEFELGDKRGGRRRDFKGTIASRRQRVSVRAVAQLPPPTFDHPSRNWFNVTASVFWSKETGAHIVIGEIRDAYLREGGPASRLGYPTASETDTDDYHGRISRFEHGEIAWDPKTGTETRLFDSSMDVQ
jgi:LGFP repeat